MASKPETDAARFIPAAHRDELMGLIMDALDAQFQLAQSTYDDAPESERRVAAVEASGDKTRQLFEWIYSHTERRAVALSREQIDHLRHMTDGHFHDDCPYCRRRRRYGGGLQAAWRDAINREP